ncbi:unnamed protein product [Boreogadus saida]
MATPLGGRQGRSQGQRQSRQVKDRQGQYQGIWRQIPNFAAVVEHRRLQDSEPVFRTTDAVVWMVEVQTGSLAFSMN